MIEMLSAFDNLALIAFAAACRILRLTPGVDGTVTIASGAAHEPRARAATVFGVSLKIFTCALAMKAVLSSWWKRARRMLNRLAAPEFGGPAARMVIN